MSITHSKVTAQGQISVPAEIRKRLGIGPGSTLEWEELSGQVVVRKAGRHSSADIHQVLFGSESATRSDKVITGIRKYIRRKHARD